ncbi:MAG: aminopeptidase P N-terminal domain-containing protein [Arsenophonus sp.]
MQNADCEFPYRKHSVFLYLTGFIKPEAVLVMINSNETSNEKILI